jgi:hypothetical protein
VVIKKSSVEKNRVVFRDASLAGYELGSRGIEFCPVFGIGSCRIMASKELLSFEVTVRLLKNALPEYD